MMKPNNDKEKIPSGDGEWNVFLIAELRDLLGRDPRVVQDERFAQCSANWFQDWLYLCTSHYREISTAALNLSHLICDESCVLENADERTMQAFLALKKLVLKLQADGNDHSHGAWLRARPFHTDAPVRTGDALNDAELSRRAVNVLYRSGIESGEQLKSLSEEQLRGIRDLGRVTLQEVLDYRIGLLQVDAPASTEERGARD